MFVAQSIRQPDQFYSAHTLSSAKRWKTRRGADSAIVRYPNSYLVIAESELGSLLHQSLFLIARIEASSATKADTQFEELALQAWERYQQQRLQESAG